MLTVGALYQTLENQIPASLSCDWDNDGLSCCADKNAPVHSVLVALDPTEEAIEHAVAGGYSVLLTHHPLLYKGLKAVNEDVLNARKVLRLLGGGVAAMSFHTRLDSVEGGVNDTLASRLGLQNVIPFGGEPAPLGRIGELPEAMSFEAFAEQVKSALGVSALLTATCGAPVRRVAVLGGAGRDEISTAFAAGADTYVTGELSYHDLCDAPSLGQNLIMAGHYHTEFPVCSVLARMLEEIDPELSVQIWTGEAVRIL